VRGAFGVGGWVRIAPHSPSSEVLRATRKWWLLGPGPAQALDVRGVRRHGGGLVAKWDGCDGPEAADGLKGARVAVARSDFPPLEPGEYYWVDLVGMRVVNRAGRELGRVKGLRTTAAHDILEIETAAKGTGILVPVVQPFFDGVDRESGTIRVDWEPEWLS
jgi:16S rRNA processing protein RimM